MDWIERVLGLAPDNGNGSAELALSLGLAALVASIWLLVHRRGTRAKEK